MGIYNERFVMSIPSVDPEVAKWWYHFDLHSKKIRSCIEQFLVDPNLKSMAGDINVGVKYKIADFDVATTKRDGEALIHIMNDAWLRAPEDRGVYQLEGFTEMCNLLDGTWGSLAPHADSEVDD